MSRNAFACIASLFEAGLDRRARCSDGGEQDKSYAGKTRETGERAREPPFCLFSLLSFFFSSSIIRPRSEHLSEHLEQANAH